MQVLFSHFESYLPLVSVSKREICGVKAAIALNCNGFNNVVTTVGSYYNKLQCNGIGFVKV